MKLSEVVGNNNKGRLSMLRGKILSGQCPMIVDAEFRRGKFSMGDVEELGWATKEHGPRRGTDVEEYWVYTGPESIKVAGKILKKGDKTTQVTADYS